VEWVGPRRVVARARGGPARALPDRVGAPAPWNDPGARDADTAYRMQLYTRCSVTRKLHRAQADTPGGHEP